MPQHKGAMECSRGSDSKGQVVQPVLSMMQVWMYEGTLADPFAEFFVEVNQTVQDTDESLWTRRNLLHSVCVCVLTGGVLG